VQKETASGQVAHYTSIITGLSSSALNAASNSAPSAPSTTRMKRHFAA
jgi:hypothetical protein